MTGSSDPEGRGLPPVLCVLAAGGSRRLGRPKALCDLGSGETALELLLRAGRVLEERVVVAGDEADRLERLLPAGTECLHNPAWEAGRTGSVAVAVRARPGRDLLLAPVDVPLVPERVFQALLREWARTGRPARGWLAPFVPPAGTPEGTRRFGHPVLIGRALLREVPHLEPDRPLRELRVGAAPLLAVEVDAEEILDDLDTPEDLERLRERRSPRNRRP